jgi:hypothetical protein
VEEDERMISRAELYARFNHNDKSLLKDPDFGEYLKIELGNEELVCLAKGLFYRLFPARELWNTHPVNLITGLHQMVVTQKKIELWKGMR